jgi:thiamine transport system substrate-binding protein
MDPADERERGIKGLKPFEKKILGIVVAVIVIVAGFAIFYSIENKKPSGKTIVICTYGSLLTYGAHKNQTYNTVFGTFEKEYGVNIKIITPSVGCLPALESRKNNEVANIVIGLTNLNGIHAARDGLLVKYHAPENNINSTLMAEMGSASSYLTPYEYSYLGIDYNKTGFTSGQFNPTFGNLLTKQNASNLLMENPTTSDTGEGFLLWQIAYYENILHQNWTTFWSSIKPYDANNIYDSWSTAFTAFESASPQTLMVSYLTDPAYNVYFGYGNDVNSTVTSYAGKEYGWRTIYNIGIVNGTGNLTLEKDFVNYFLSPTVQNQIPTNEWMYPANETIAMPPSYSATMNQSEIIPLNNYISAEDIYLNSGNWILQWQALME